MMWLFYFLILGPIGFACLLAAKASGASKICMTGTDHL